MPGIMASSTARAFQTVKPHIPLIKFRSGKQTAANPAIVTSTSQTNTESSPITSKGTNVASPGTTLEHHQLPRRYARIPLSLEEMEYIQRGGPD
ncbi:alpha-ketoglutarate dehydrogenase component 4-like [Saccostrea echinata]|uniref:alpha-ketoglutarate dehydrogenase component 4-like n=1 Tax=Saccostrea echinata TaxID=191078 RepID=UPI002A82CAB1|nr:alpha-ketoglutarate dehydrogenase component 4-like [Saccostrea echinata]